jgi:hypothetical protein
MIDKVLIFLRDHLNAYLNAISGLTPGDSGEPKVVFIDGDKMDPITFKLGAVSALLINIEEENAIRPADPYSAVSADGTHRKAQPEIRMNLYVLFVARFKHYEQGLSYLSQIIQHFQTYRQLTHHNAPEMSDDIEQLIMELTTLPFSEQNEMWNALRTTYHPSVLYKVKMVVFRDEDIFTKPEIMKKDLRISQ